MGSRAGEHEGFTWGPGLVSTSFAYGPGLAGSIRASRTGGEGQMKQAEWE